MDVAQQTSDTLPDSRLRPSEAAIATLLSESEENARDKGLSNGSMASLTSSARTMDHSEGQAESQVGGIRATTAVVEQEQFIFLKGSCPRLIRTAIDAIKRRDTCVAMTGLIQCSATTDSSSSHHLAACIRRNINQCSKSPVIIATLNTTHKHASVCFLFSGLGSQCASDLPELMSIVPFAEMMRECETAVAGFGVPLSSTIRDVCAAGRTGHPTLNINAAGTCVLLVAMQISLARVALMTNIAPEFFIGHSLGEHVCAYYDGLLTLREVLLITFYQVLLATPPSAGAMAAVHMSAAAFLAAEYHNVHLACDNSDAAITVAGDESDVHAFARARKNEGHLVSIIDSCSIPFHTPLVESTRRARTSQCDELLGQRRFSPSRRWIQSDVATRGTQLSLSAFFSANLSEPVHFRSSLEKLPKNVTVIEVSPKSILCKVVEHVLPTARVIPLLQRSTPCRTSIANALFAAFQHGSCSSPDFSSLASSS